MSKAREFVDDTPRHLTTRTAAVSQPRLKLSELADREFWCRECNARVTQTPDETGEYGHKPDCKHSIRRRDEHALEWRGTEDET